jgi:leucyl/phenylalanyl-tRNA--protein transferase
MPVDGRLGWWSPDPRGIIDRLKVSRSLTKATSKFEIRIDTAFEEVITSCAKPNRPGGWITDHIKRAYIDLHHRGWAHSVEAWADGELQGGLYGIAIGGFFAGESMFHRRTDASKVALVALQNITDEDGLLDVQWCTDHLASLGAREIPRTEYVARLQNAIQLPLPPALGGDGQVVGPVGHARHAEL